MKISKTKEQEIIVHEAEYQLTVTERELQIIAWLSWNAEGIRVFGPDTIYDGIRKGCRVDLSFANESVYGIDSFKEWLDNGR